MLELGNMAFNPNTNQNFECEEYIIALLRELDRELSRVMWNVHQKEYDSPFDNTGNSYKNAVFEVQAYNWNDDIQQEYNFRWEDVKISWYKYLGRDTTINKPITAEYAVKMFNDCLERIRLIERSEFDYFDFD